MIESRPIVPQNDGWLEVRVPKNIMDDLWGMIDTAGRDAKFKLAGNISASKEMNPTDTFKKFIGEVTKEYGQHFKYKTSEMITMIPENASIQLHDLWVNWQYQHEFNPSHVHFGLYSFVIWMKMPVETTDQMQLPIAKSTSSCLSCFQFEYFNTFGQKRLFNYPMGKEIEGLMVFFPAVMNHLVYPFYDSTEPRISVAGNMAWM